MKTCALLVATGLFLAGCEGTNQIDVPNVPDGKFPATERYDLPVVLTAKEPGAMGAVTASTLARRGPCLYLGTGPEEAVIVWEDGAKIDTASERGFAIVLPSGLRVVEGDKLRGAGGTLPSVEPISDFTNESVPAECATGDAVQFHGIQIVESAQGNEPGRGPPPPPPPAPSFLENLKDNDTGEGTVREVIRGVDDPREALFMYILGEIRRDQDHRNPPACLRDVDDELYARLSQQFDEIHRAGDCRWSDGGVILRRNEKGAVFVSANLDCDGRARCVAEGARVYGNVGGEGEGYILRPVTGGWEIRTVGLSWMS